jgi:NADH-quinone oxidoreductase subunit J
MRSALLVLSLTIAATASAQQPQPAQPAQPQPGQPRPIQPAQPGQPQAQPPRPPLRQQVQPEIVQRQAADTGDAPKYGKGASVAFWIFAAMVVLGAVLTITRRNPVSAVMCLVATFVALAALYAMLFAHFLAVIQVLVYAGAIMVLFVFVIMILNKEEEEPWALRGVVSKVLAVVGLGYVAGRLIQVLWNVRTDDTMREAAWRAGELAQFGTTKGVGKVLFTSYLFPFEAISIVLLVAVVGALVLAHPEHPTALQDGALDEAVEPEEEAKPHE